MTSPPLSELARPGRRAVVAPDLSGFHGPTRGTVELPHRMFWQANRTLDLDKPFMLAWLYEIVLLEALTHEELRTWLDAPTLHRLWATLYLPHGVRRDWERQHPSLRDARLTSPRQANPSYDGWLARQSAA
ncbi:hypothetical protein WEI85_30355 [Actinomycetes bacterium KLBMP 9797]